MKRAECYIFGAAYLSSSVVSPYINFICGPCNSFPVGIVVATAVEQCFEIAQILETFQDTGLPWEKEGAKVIVAKKNMLKTVSMLLDLVSLGDSALNYDFTAT